MRSLRSGYVFTALVVIGAILMLPVSGHAQESTVSGTVTDPTGAVIPGVMVTATHTETGNKFEAVTDERGSYRLLVRVGNYRITAGLPGFGTVNRNIDRGAYRANGCREYRNDALDGRRNGKRCR